MVIQESLCQLCPFFQQLLALCSGLPLPRARANMPEPPGLPLGTGMGVAQGDLGQERSLGGGMPTPHPACCGSPVSLL